MSDAAPVPSPRRAPPAHEPWHALRVLREKDGHSQNSLARAAGMSVGYLCDLENGHRRPTARVVRLLAVALNVPISVLEPRRPTDVPALAAETPEPDAATPIGA